MVGVQVAQQHRIDEAGVQMCLQGTKGAVPEVEQHPEAVVLDEIAGGGGVGSGHAARATDDREPHQANAPAWSTQPISGPTNRRASGPKVAGSPVTRNRCSGSFASGDRRRSRSASTR